MENVQNIYINRREKLGTSIQRKLKKDERYQIKRKILPRIRNEQIKLFIESGKSDPTLKTLERIAELTNSTLVIDLIPNELEQVELQIEEEKQ